MKVPRHLAPSRRVPRHRINASAVGRCHNIKRKGCHDTHSASCGRDVSASGRRFIPMPFRGRSDVKQGFRQSTYRHSSPGTELGGRRFFSFCLGFFAVFKIPYLRAVFYLQPFNFIFARLRYSNTAADVFTSFECSLMRQSRKLGFPERKCRISYGSSQR